jgi:uncharacterized membrane-anchored protein YhcB (DUF1043 family)
MIWIGIIVGFVTGVVLVTLCYTPLVDKVKTLEQKLIRDKDLIDEAIKTLRHYENQNNILRADLKQLQALVPPEVYARFFHAPYN